LENLYQINYTDRTRMNIQDTKKIEELISDFSHESYLRRDKAVIELAAFGEAAILPLITTFSSDSTWASIDGHMALVQIGEKAIPALLDSLSDSDIHTRYWSACTLGDIKDERAVVPLLEAFTNELTSKVRRSIIGALGKIGDKRAIKALIQAFQDDDSFVRSGVAMALGHFADQEAIIVLIPKLEDEDNFVRLKSADALGKIGDSQAIAPLITALSKEKEIEVSYAIVRALGQFKGNSQVVETLLPLLKNPAYDSNLRCEVALALGKLGDIQAVPLLIQTLRDKDYNVRYWCIEALGQLGDKRALPTLTHIKEKEKWGFVDREESFYPANKAADEAIKLILQKEV